MRGIMLTKGQITYVDDEDYWIVCKYYWYLQTSAGNKLYARNNTVGMMHRLIMNTPDNMEVDHIDGDGLNNLRSNLRVCEHHQNIHNRLCSSNCKGVSWDKINNNFRAYIWLKGRRLCLGGHKHKEDAIRAYNKAATTYLGEFARLNEVPDER